MDNATHTPGPWVYDTTGPVTRYVVFDDESGDAIASTYGQASQDADARLIAAAPDLLAALEAVVTPSGWDKLDTGGRGTHGAALAAIAKARGEQ